MDTVRHGLATSYRRLTLAVLACAFSPVAGTAASPVAGPIRLTAAAEKGAFNVGAARAALAPSEGGSGGLQLDFTLPPGTAAGVWAKSFPDAFTPGSVEVVRGRVTPAGPGVAPSVTAVVEIKGTAGTQRVSLGPVGGPPVEVAVDWSLIGRVNEVVVLLAPAAEKGVVEGAVLLDVQFDRLPPLRKLSTKPVGRMAGVLLLAMLAAGLMVAVGRSHRPPPTSELWRDVVHGVGAVAVAGLVVGVYHLGGRGPLEVGWTALAVAAAGVVVVAWWTWGLTGRPPTPGQAFEAVIANGLPAASVAPIPLLQAPASWSDALLLSQFAAAAVVLAYHVTNAVRCSVAGRPMGAVGTGLLVSAPYLVGVLLLLRSDRLVEDLGHVLAAGTLDGPSAEAVGRVLVLFTFNAFVVTGLSWATGGRLLRPGRAYLALLAVAAAAVAGPWVAAVGAGEAVAAWPAAARAVAAVVAAAVSQAGLWAEVYLITGLALSALRRVPPTSASVVALPVEGARKGAVFSGTFMALVHVAGLLRGVPGVRGFAEAYPALAGVIAGTVAFPLLKTVIESFDGSRSFFGRLARSYRDPVLYARGAVAGLGFGAAVSADLAAALLATRAGVGLLAGAAAFAGVNFVRDWWWASTERGQIQPARVYLVQALLGGFIGAAVGFYLDAPQVAAVGAKFERYLAAGAKPEPFDVYPLVSKWGYISLGPVTGGPSLLFAEALAGVIEWSIPAWLFALNRTVLLAYFRKEVGPLRDLFTRAGLEDLTAAMLAVFRWGLWMSPVIKSFLRPVGEPTWYNQDGAVRTLLAAYQDLTLDHQAFRAWSLEVFVSLLAYDVVRITIWLDHMGLRVATLVNLSFLGMDKLDERLARFLSPAATARCVPEAVKRFTTWAPLLIPFYIPRGADWDYAWEKSQALQRADTGGWVTWAVGLPPSGQLALLVGLVAGATALSAAVRLGHRRFGPPESRAVALSNRVYEVTVEDTGAVVGTDRTRGYDLSRRSYDRIDPAGRALFLVEASSDGPQFWTLVGTTPAETGDHSVTFRMVTVGNTAGALRLTVEITLPGADDAAELWTVTVENPGPTPRAVRLVPYLEWVLNKPDADRGHTQYNRLFAELEYRPALHAVLAWDKHAKAAGVLASDAPPDGFLTARADFIGRARSVRSPRVLETLAFHKPEPTPPHPTLDPIAALSVGLIVPADGTAQVRFLMGMATDRAEVAELVTRYLGLSAPPLPSAPRLDTLVYPVGHGEPPELDGPYAKFSPDVRTLVVRTPFTPRPFDHTLSNALGHTVSVTNRGLHTSASVNAQQNRLTPDWADTVTREAPGEAITLYDPDRDEWFSPTYHPLNDPTAGHLVEFGADGTATFHTAKSGVETELTVFVPPDEPAGVYLLTVRNRGPAARRLRLGVYFQIVLAAQPEHAGPLVIRRDDGLNALFFENPRNRFRTGPAFASLSVPADRMETHRGRFLGAGGSVAHPVMVARGEPDPTGEVDDRPVAGFLSTLEIPAGREQTVVVVLGQADDRLRAEKVVRKLRDVAAARAALADTRRWWDSFLDTVRVHTAQPAFGRYLDWLKYQALAERIWARRGFYQASGAFGFRDQLQDAVNLLWADPVIARRQILLHAAQQFVEGDVVHWFHRLQDGRTGFVGRTHASDNLLWLPWAVADYLRATGDETLLAERVPYLESDLPFEALPAGKHGMGFDPLRSARTETVYRHCLRAVDLVLNKRMGRHGLPLMGTGDWNDGLDEIGSQGRGESVWLGFFLYYILDRLLPVIATADGSVREEHYRGRLGALGEAIEGTWRGDRYLRAIHDDGTEIGVAGSGVWEIDALTAGWAVMSGVNPDRGRQVFDTAVSILERDDTILLGWPPLREDTKPYLGRSSWYPEGVRENGMYCHGVQWLVGAARILADRFAREGRHDEAQRYRETAYRLWLKVSAIPHTTPDRIDTYGGQPNKQAADLVTTFDPGRMIWNGYTGAAGWVFRQGLEGVLGVRLVEGKLEVPGTLTTADELGAVKVVRDVSGSPFTGPPELRPPAQTVASDDTGGVSR